MLSANPYGAIEGKAAPRHHGYLMGKKKKALARCWPAAVAVARAGRAAEPFGDIAQLSTPYKRARCYWTQHATFCGRVSNCKPTASQWVAPKTALPSVVNAGVYHSLGTATTAHPRSVPYMVCYTVSRCVLFCCRGFHCPGRRQPDAEKPVRD